MKKTVLFLILIVNRVVGQDTIPNKKITVDFSGYIDAFYSYNFDKPESKNQFFLYNYNRQNEFNINIALLRASINYDNFYAKISVQAGTYVDDNYANEDIKFLNEAYLGLYLNKSQKTSIEVGILPSYIGFETAVSHSNLTATRSILAENSPYFMTGIKLNHQFNAKFSGAVLITNGWQRIKKVNNDLFPSLGTQLVYKPSDNSIINWSTFIGKEAVANYFAMRYFSNLYWDKTWNAKWRTILGFDYGIQDMPLVNDVYQIWCSPILITQYKLSPKWNLAHRIEYYQDKKNIVIAANLPFETLGNSINLDFLPNTKTKIRTEGKWYHATESILDQGNKKDNFSITTTLSFEF